MTKQEAINHTSEAGKSSMSKAKEFVQHHGKKLMGALAITAAMATTEATAQNTATIDPKYYSMSNPYIVPNLPDRSTINVLIKTGAPTPIRIDWMDAGSTVNTSDPSGNDIPVVNDELILNKPGTRGRLYKENWVLKITSIQVNYQADIYDRTPGSSTQNQRP